MNIFNKIFLLCLLTLLFSNYSSPVFASAQLFVNSSNNSGIVNNTITQNILLNIKADTDWVLTIVPLDSSLKNQSRADKEISVNDIYILDNKLSNIYYFEQNKTVQIDSGIAGTYNKKYALKIESRNPAYAGIYAGAFKFTLISGNETATYIYNLSFNNPEIKKITILPDSLHINISPSDAMKKRFNHTTNSPTKIVIESNTDWQLVLKNEAKENPLKCKFKVSAVSGKSKILYGTDYTDLPNKDIIVVQGQATISEDKKILDSEVIQIKYLFISPDNDIQDADSYLFNVNYDLISK